MAKYKALVGMNYPVSPSVIAELMAIAMMPEGEERQTRTHKIIAEGGFKRIEKNAVVDDLPSQSVPWMLGQRMIELVEDTAEPVESKKPKRPNKVIALVEPIAPVEPTAPIEEGTS
jgi:hypothetical protein